jgi:hypothetical protein
MGQLEACIAVEPWGSRGSRLREGKREEEAATRVGGRW